MGSRINKAALLAAVLTTGISVLPQKAGATLNYTTYGTVYTQNFDTLPNPPSVPSPLGSVSNTDSLGQGPGTAIVNDWFGTAGSPTPVLDKSVTFDDGSLGTNGFKNLGEIGSSDRAYGFQGTGGVYVGFEIQNKIQLLDKLTFKFDLEIWRRSAGTDVSNFLLQYRISSTPLANLAAGGGTWLTMPVSAATSIVYPTAVAAGDVYTHDGPVGPVSTISVTSNLGGISWTPNSYLYIRLSNTSDTDTAAGFDNVSFQAIPEPSTWVAGGLLLGFAAFTQIKRRKAAAMEVAA